VTLHSHKFTEYSTENFRNCLYISLVHLLLAPEWVMRSQGHQLMTTCASLMGDIKNEGVVMLIRLVDSFIRALPVLGSETVMPILPKIFEWVLLVIWTRKTTFEWICFSRIYCGEDYPLLMSLFLCTLARVLLSSHPVFTRVISELAREKGEDEQVTLEKILDRWLTKMSNVAQLDQRKLLGKAFALFS